MNLLSQQSDDKHFSLSKKNVEHSADWCAMWLPLLIPVFEELGRYAHRVFREENELLAAEKAAAVAEADQNDQVLSVKEAAKLLGLRPQTVYEWVKAEKLTHFKIGRHVRFKRGHVLAALKLQTQPDGRRKYARRTTGRPGRDG